MTGAPSIPSSVVTPGAGYYFIILTFHTAHFQHIPRDAVS